MSDETTDKPTDPTDTLPEPVRLVPLSDIDAFVEIRAGSIIDEAALLAIQFLGGRDGDRNIARTTFVRMAMEHFDTIGDAYDAKRWETAMLARRAGMMLARKRQREAADKAGTEPAEPISAPDTPMAADPEPAK